MDELTLLIVDDEKRVQDELGEFFGDFDLEILNAFSPSKAYEIIEKQNIDIVILDIRLPEEDGLSVLGKLKYIKPEMEIIMISGHGDMDSVIKAMRSGASDFFQKPFRLNDIYKSVERSRKIIDLNKKVNKAEHDFKMLTKDFKTLETGNIIAESESMKEVLVLMSKVAKTGNTSVLITGETGTGKELVARGIHEMSSRHKKYFYAVNCSAIPEQLFESEFFGHTKGAFTDAKEEKMGWFEIADGGTLFLDEIGDLPISQQSKILRVLEERRITRLGSRKSFAFDVRIIAATNKMLEGLDSFRDDLLHRLNAFGIEVLPLREHRADIIPLANHYVKLFSQKHGVAISEISQSVYDFLLTHHFQGNVRELRNLVERAIILSEDNVLTLANFEDKRRNSSTKDEVSISDTTNEIFDLEQIEEKTIKKALLKADSKSDAAKLLNISWQSLDRRLKKYGIV